MKSIFKSYKKPKKKDGASISMMTKSTDFEANLLMYDSSSNNCVTVDMPLIYSVSVSRSLFLIRKIVLIAAFMS